MDAIVTPTTPMTAPKIPPNFDWHATGIIALPFLKSECCTQIGVFSELMAELIERADKNHIITWRALDTGPVPAKRPRKPSQQNLILICENPRSTGESNTPLTVELLKYVFPGSPRGSPNTWLLGTSLV